MRKMTEQHWRAFVTYGTRTGKLSTARAEGSPHVTPVWFFLDGDDIVLTTEKNGVKGRNLARDGRFALCVDEDRPRTRSSSSKAARRSPKTRTTCCAGAAFWVPGTWATTAPKSTPHETAAPATSSSGVASTR